MKTYLFYLPAKFTMSCLLICCSMVPAFAEGNIVNYATATMHIRAATGKGDAPNGIYLVPLGAEQTGSVRVSAGMNGSRSTTLAYWSNTGTTHGYHHDCPPYCKQLTLDNAAVPKDLLEHTMEQEVADMSGEEASTTISNFTSGTDHISVSADAVNWLRRQGAQYMEIARGRDSENHCELIIGGYDSNGNIVGNGSFYVQKVACPGE